MRAKTKREVDRAYKDTIEAMRKQGHDPGYFVSKWLTYQAMTRCIATLIVHRRERKEDKHVP